MRPTSQPTEPNQRPRASDRWITAGISVISSALGAFLGLLLVGFTPFSCSRERILAHPATIVRVTEAEFPWPAPMPSTFYKIPRRLLRPASTLGQVADRLDDALAQAGYTERKFYRVGADGFAIATRLESILPDGRSRPQAQRWIVDTPPTFSLDDILRALLRASRGLYRVWGFVITPTPAPFKNPVVERDLERLIDRGDLKLSLRARTLPFTANHDCFALVYEFERRDAPPMPALRMPSPLPAQQHLVASNIMRRLKR